MVAKFPQKPYCGVADGISFVMSTGTPSLCTHYGSSSKVLTLNAKTTRSNCTSSGILVCVQHNNIYCTTIYGMIWNDDPSLLLL